MHPIKIRDLETGEVLTRHGHTAHEILSSREPERDQDGNVVTDPDTGEIVYSTKRRFVQHGSEPAGWKKANASLAVAGDAAEKKRVRAAKAKAAAAEEE